MKAPAFFIVKVWISPEEGENYVKWLDTEHIPKLIGESRVLWVRRSRLEVAQETGDTGHILIHGIDTPDSLKRYFDSPVHKRLLQKLERSKKPPKVEYFFGTLDFDLASPGHTGNEEANVLYFVRCSVAPKSRAKFLGWLDRGHLAEVINQPGFLWVRRVHLEGPDDDGWERYLLIYGQANIESLKEYLNNPIRERFSREMEPFIKDLRRESFIGLIESVFDRK